MAAKGGGDKAPERPGVYLDPTRIRRRAGAGRGYPQGLSYTRPLGQLYGEGGERRQAKTSKLPIQLKRQQRSSQYRGGGWEGPAKPVTFSYLYNGGSALANVGEGDGPDGGGSGAGPTGVGGNGQGLLECCPGLKRIDRYPFLRFLGVLCTPLPTTGRGNG